MPAYIALLRKDDASDFGMDFPDFPGCVTAGSTLEEARLMAAEALEFHIEGMTEDREPIPEASSLDRIMDAVDNRAAIAFLVDVATTAGAAGISGTLPEALVAEIDRATPDRARFLMEAASAKLRGAD